MERGTELLFAKKRIEELRQEKEEVDEMKKRYVSEKDEMKDKMGREIRILKESMVKMAEENAGYRKAIEEMGSFFNKINDLILNIS